MSTAAITITVKEEGIINKESSSTEKEYWEQKEEV
jgi:hypothetical protein